MDPDYILNSSEKMRIGIDEVDMNEARLCGLSRNIHF